MLDRVERQEVVWGIPDKHQDSVQFASEGVLGVARGTVGVSKHSKLLLPRWMDRAMVLECNAMCANVSKSIEIGLVAARGSLNR